MAGLFGALPPMAAEDTKQQLPDTVVDIAHAQLQSGPFGELRVHFEGATPQARAVTAGSARLKPGMAPHPPHQHPEDEFLIVAEGTGEISIEERVTKVGPGDIAFCAGNKMHGIRNTGGGAMVFYFFKWRA